MFFVGSEVLPAVTRNPIFWDIMPRTPLEDNRNFGRNRQEAELYLLPVSCWIFGLACLTYRSYNWRRYPPKGLRTFSKLHSIVSQNIYVCLFADRKI